MHYDAWFSSPFAYDIITDLDFDKIKNKCYTVKSESTGCVKSNAGGWQSDNLSFDIDEFKPLYDLIHIKINELHTQYGFKSNQEQHICNIWININEQGSFNRPHVHPNSVLSGVIYIDCNPLTSGDIVFINPVIAHSYHWSDIAEDKNSLIASGTCFYKPEKGKIVIFPSWVQHYVEPNKDLEPRISISFNTKLVSKDGRD
jgi:uncharacterized protein (TIGR02466 family)